MMKHLFNLVREPGFQLFLFFAGLLLFGWPLLSIPMQSAGSAGSAGSIYLFTVWGIFILLLFLIGRAGGN